MLILLIMLRQEYWQMILGRARMIMCSPCFNAMEKLRILCTQLLCYREEPKNKELLAVFSIDTGVCSALVKHKADSKETTMTKVSLMVCFLLIFSFSIISFLLLRQTYEEKGEQAHMEQCCTAGSQMLCLRRNKDVFLHVIYNRFRIFLSLYILMWQMLE